MKKTMVIFFICFLFLGFVSFAEVREGTAPTEKVRIVKIKIVIDSNEYEWTIDGINRLTVDNNGSETTATSVAEILRPETVMSFLSVYPNESATEDALVRQCRESELCLTESGYVYEASLQIVPPRKNPTERTIVVTVSQGFFWRFGGGGIYGMVGKDGLGGDRASVRLYAGWNRNGIKYVHNNVGDSSFVLGGSLFYLGPGKSNGTTITTATGTAGVPFEAAVMTGYFFNPGLLVGVDGSVLLPDVLPRGNSLFSIQPFLEYRKHLIPGDPTRYGNESDIGFDARGYIYPTLPAKKSEGSAFIHGRVLEKTMIALKGAGGISMGDCTFDLFLTEDRNIRSGYPAETLMVPSFAFGSAEIRQNIASFTVPPAFNCGVQLFGFSDVAVLSGDIRFVDAYGVGARILFDNPVFAYFSFSYGVNHDGAGRVLFCGTAGF